MQTEVKIVLYDELPLELRRNNNFETADAYHSNYFWHKCAEKWHYDNIHKVYVIVSTDSQQILGYFSIRASEIKNNKNEHIPIVDISFIDVNKNLDVTTSYKIFKALLEFIEFNICKDLITKIGCRFIRCYIPTTPIQEANGNFISGDAIFPFIENLFEDMHYIDPPIKEKNKIRKIKDKLNKKSVKLVLRYYIRDLLTE